MPIILSPRKTNDKVSCQLLSHNSSNKDDQSHDQDIIDIDDDFTPSQLLSEDQDIKEILQFLKNTYKPLSDMKDMDDEEKLQILEQKNNELDLKLKFN